MNTENISYKKEAPPVVANPANPAKEAARLADIKANQLMNENLSDPQGLFRVNLKQVIPGSILKKRVYEPQLKNDKGYDVYVLSPPIFDCKAKTDIEKTINEIEKNKILIPKRKAESEACFQKFDHQGWETYGKAMREAERNLKNTEDVLPILINTFSNRWNGEIKKLNDFKNQVMEIIEGIDNEIEQATETGKQFLKQYASEPAKGKK